MRVLSVLILVLGCFSVFSNELVEGSQITDIYPLDEYHRELDVDYIYTELPSEIIITQSVLKQVLAFVDSINEECEVDYMRAETFVTKSGTKYHTIYSSEDICDGGNSMGIVIDSKLKIVAEVFDSFIYLLDTEEYIKL